MKTYLWILLSLFLVTGCEKLEDTYDDYAGDGAIRYLGKCTDVKLTPGWKKLNVRWINSVDPMVEKIKVTWKINGVSEEVLLDKNATEYTIPDLEDGSYAVTVCGIDKNQNCSLSTPFSGRPYTLDHEEVLSFSRLIAKHYFVKNHVVLFFSTWEDRMSSAELKYYTADGNLKTLALTELLINQQHYLLPDEIDPNRPVTLYRQGRLEEKGDVIVFAPYELSLDKLYTTEFRSLLRTKYGQFEITDDFAERQEELEFDHSITSFEDILNFPNLKKVILGKNRYLKADHLNTNGSDSKLHEVERSLFVLDVANQLCGLTVDRYNQHYLPGKTLPYMTEKGNPVVPELDCLDASDWVLSCSQKDIYPFESNLKYLFDGDFDNWWQPELLSLSRSYEINVDMNEAKSISGMRIVQKTFAPTDAASKSILPSVIKIKVSMNKVVWEDATYVEEEVLGATNGEINVVHFSSPKQVRYIKFVVYDQVFGMNYAVTLSDIGIF